MNFLIEWFDVVDSTNDVLKRRIERNRDEADSGILLAARMQTAGRGRHRRAWLAESGKNLLFSFFVKTDAPLMDVPALTMAVAMGIDDTLRDVGVTSVLKWPNDVLVGEKKICGILSEGIPGVGVVVGVGLNVNMSQEALAKVDRPATSILAETGVEWKLDQLLDRLLKNLPRWVERWETDRFAGLRRTFERKCAAFYREVSVRDGERVESGLLIGFGSHGEALLRRADGSEVAVWAGDLREGSC
jgi:BirA family biotin operon repressor/biotin-[acetyl-CoA-carboxylase] ligase